MSQGAAEIQNPTDAPHARHALARPRRVPGRWAGMLVALAVVAVAGVVHGVGMSTSPVRFDDEGTYVSQAWAVQSKGSLGHYTYWYDHPPLGWITIALWTWATGAFERSANAVAAGREFLLIAHLMSCASLYVLARRLSMGRAFAAVAVALFSLSPLAVFFHRMVLLDNLAMTWAIAAFALALTPSRRLWAYAASGACLGAAALTKETALLLLPALALAVWQSSDRRTRSFCVAVFSSALFMVGSIYPLFALLKGELLPGAGHVSLVDGVVFQLFSRESSGSVFDPTSLARANVDGWLAADPWLLCVALALSTIALLVRRLRAITLAFVLQAVMILRPGYLPFGHAIGMLPFAALIVAGVCDALWKWRLGQGIGNPARGALAGAVVRPWRFIGPVLTATALALAAGFVVPHWAAGDWRYMRDDQDVAYREATQWISQHVDREDRLLVDNSVWIDLVHGGFDSSAVEGGFYSDQVIWFWKLDRDPAVVRRFPGGWRDFDYVVSSEILRSSIHLTRQTPLALTNSRVVARFGAGPGRVEIRRVQPWKGARTPAPVRARGAIR